MRNLASRLDLQVGSHVNFAIVESSLIWKDTKPGCAVDNARPRDNPSAGFREVST